MLQELITKTNTEDFYSDGNLHPISIKGHIGGFNTVELEFVIEEDGLDEKEDGYYPWKKVEYWKVIAHKAIQFNNLFAPIYLPYVKLRLLDDHPLLWEFKTDELECELTGEPENYHEFVGVLYHTFEENAGNWITFDKRLFNMAGSKPAEWKKALTIPEPMRQPIMNVCKDFGIEFRVNEVISGDNKGYTNRPDLKLLMFGNEDVSSYDFNLGQPYIIAENFIANKK